MAVGGTGFDFLCSFSVLSSVELLLPGFFDFRPPLVPSPVSYGLMLRATVTFGESAAIEAGPVESHELSFSLDLAVTPRRSSSSFSKHGMQSLIAVRVCCIWHKGHMFLQSVGLLVYPNREHEQVPSRCRLIVLSPM